MKKLFLLFFLMTISLGQSQVFPLDYTDLADRDFAPFNGAVVNYTTDAGNDVVRFIGAAANFDGATSSLTQNLIMSDNANNTITFRIKNTTARAGTHLFKLEGGAPAAELAFTTTSSAAWQNITIDFGAGLGSYSGFTIFTDFNNTLADTYLLDDFAGGTNAPAAVPPTLTSPTATSITNNSAILGANITSNGGATGTDRGFSMKTSSPVLVTDAQATAGGGNLTGVYSNIRPGLQPQTQYFYRGYATNNFGATYGQSPEGTFRTLSNPPTAQPASFSTVSGDTQLTANWTAATFPGSGATAAGYLVIYSTGTPTLSSINGTAPTAGVGTLINITSGNLTPALTTGAITGLINTTNYNFLIVPYTWNNANNDTYNYFTASARTTTGTPFGAGPPQLSLPTAIAITDVSATLGATVLANGLSALTERGTAYKTTAGVAATDNNLAEGGTAVSIFSHSRSGLLPQTQYFYVGYAINSIPATGISAEGSFRTLSSPASVQPVTFTATPTSGTITANWSNETSFPASGATNAGYLLLYSTGTPTMNVAGANGKAPTLGNAFTTGTVINVTSTVLPLVPALTAAVSGLTPGTYNLLIVPYTWDGVNATTYNYLTAGARTASAIVPAVSYTWTASGGGAWNTPGNWSPARTTPAATDILNFTAGAGATQVITGVASGANQTIGRLNVSGNISVFLQSIAGQGQRTITIASDNVPGTDELSIASGSSLTLRTVDGGTSVVISYSGTGATANIAGTFEIIQSTAPNIYNFGNCVTTVTSTGLFATGNVANPGAYTTFSGDNTTSLRIFGTYQHKFIGALQNIPSATWEDGSTCLITTFTSVPSPAFGGNAMNQNFYNFTWNCPGQGAGVANVGGTKFQNNRVRNNFTITSTGTSGSLVFDTSNSDYIQNYIQTGGIFNLSNSATAAVLNVRGNFSQTGGTITETSTGSGTINLSGTALQTYTSGGTLANTINHTIANNAIVDFGTSIITNGSNGAFTLATGGKIITANANGLTSSGAAGTVQSTGTRTYNSGARYEFKGANTGNFTLSTPNTITSTNGLTFSASSAGTVTLGQNLTAASLDLTDNKVTTGAFTLTLSGAATAVSRTTGWVNGNFNKTITGNSTKTFEIGDATVYTPVTLNFTGTITAGSITAKSTAGDTQPQIATSGFNLNRNVNRFYTLTPTGVSGLTSYSPVFSYDSADNDIAATPSNYVIRNYNGTWSAPSISGTPTSTSASTTGLTTYGDFVIGEDKIALVITADSSEKCFGSTKTFAGTEFTITSGSLESGHTIDAVTLSSTGAGPGATVVGGPYPIVASNATGTGLSNYDITYLNGSLIVNALPTATIAVNNNTVCINQAAPIVTFTGGIGTGPFIFTYNRTTVINGVPTTVNGLTSSGTVNVPTNAAGTITYTLVSVQDANGCSQNQGGSVLINVNLCTQLRSIQCGKTMRWIDEAIQAAPVSGATQYRFIMVRTDNPADIIDVTASNYWFRTSKLIYGKTYNVTVALFIGSWGVPGPVCTLAAPPEPAIIFTRVRDFQCNKTLRFMSSRVEAMPVYSATSYEFEVTSAAGTFVKPSVSYHFSLTGSVPGGALPNTAYTIRVRTFIGNTLLRDWGAACVVTTPLARMSETNVSDTILNVKAFPNPFASHFNLDIESSSDAQVELKVYDMIGRQLEVRKATVSELSVLEVGHNYPSGVYNLVISQGDKVKSIRMIKR